jgi:hypothetical protein
MEIALAIEILNDVREKSFDHRARPRNHSIQPVASIGDAPFLLAEFSYRPYLAKFEAILNAKALKSRR